MKNLGTVQLVLQKGTNVNSLLALSKKMIGFVSVEIINIKDMLIENFGENALDTRCENAIQIKLYEESKCQLIELTKNPKIKKAFRFMILKNS